MRQFEYVIQNPDGLYAQPAVLLGKKVKEFDGAKVTVSKDGNSVLATRLMALIGLNAYCGDKITVTVEGGDEESACRAIETLLNENL